MASQLDSGWQLSESYGECSSASRPFELQDLPTDHPARPAFGPGTASTGTTASSISANDEEGSSSSSDDGGGGGNLCHVAILSTYVPRECGIAIYSERLVRGLEAACGPNGRIEVIPVKHKDMELSEYDPKVVKVAISEWELSDYLAAAEYVNAQGFGLVLLQYEFGIWPVAHALCFAKAVKTRLITTVHTVRRANVFTEEPKQGDEKEKGDEA